MYPNTVAKLVQPQSGIQNSPTGPMAQKKDKNNENMRLAAVRRRMLAGGPSQSMM